MLCLHIDIILTTLTGDIDLATYLTDAVTTATINMYKYIVLTIALSTTSCVTNWERNRKLNDEIFYEYLVKPNLVRSMMGQDGPVCSTAESVK